MKAGERGVAGPLQHPTAYSPYFIRENAYIVVYSPSAQESAQNVTRIVEQVRLIQSTCSILVIGLIDDKTGEVESGTSLSGSSVPVQKKIQVPENDSNVLCMDVNISNAMLQSLSCAEIIMHSMKKKNGLEWISNLQYPAATCAAIPLLLKIDHDYTCLDLEGCVEAALYGSNQALESGENFSLSYVDCFRLLVDRGATVKMIGVLAETYPLAVAHAIQVSRHGQSLSGVVSRLNLSNSHLHSLPRVILCAFHVPLTHLNVSHNEIEELPPELFVQPTLKAINASHNKIRMLPPAKTWTCIKLTTLNVSNNLLTGTVNSRLYTILSNKLQPFVERVTDVFHHFNVNFKGNKHRASLENRLKKLQALANVDLSHNKLEAVPTWITLLPDLKSINLSENDCLNYIPPQLVQYSRDIISINVEGLKLISPPMREVRRGTSYIQCYLNSQLRNAVYYRHMRLMLVGSCAVGKTTLVARLKGGSLPKNLSTVGIDLSEFSYKPSHLRLHPRVTFHTLDFAGQEDYYSTHQCFFTRVAIYLALFDLRDGKASIDQLKPWLLSIHACAPGAVVIIVGTHLDILIKSGSNCNEIRKEIETEFLVGHSQQAAASQGLPHVIDFLCVSSVTGLGISQLKQRLYQAAFDVEHPDCKSRKFFNVRVPACHLFIQECLEKKAIELLSLKQAPVLTKQEFESLVTDHPDSDIQDTREIGQAARFLHELGALLHYENATGELQNLYFIDLQFLSTAMACIVTSQERSLVRNGILHYASMSLLFKGGEVPSQLYRQFMQLLQHFEVAIPLDKEQQVFLIPAMLHKARLAHKLPKDLSSTVIGRRYHMTYVPVGFWSRLISRITVFAHAVGWALLQAPETLHDWADGAKVNQTHRQWYCWQRGLIILQENGSFLMLEDVTGLQGVDVFACGDLAACSRLLSVSSHHIDTLLDEFYPGLSNPPSEVQKFALCTKCIQESWTRKDESGLAVSEESLFNLTDILNENKMKLICLKCETPLSVKEIAPDFVLLDLPSHLQLQPEKLILDESEENCIGEGGYGKVYRAEYNGENIALKMYGDKGTHSYTEVYRDLRQEIDILSRIHHPNVVAIKGVRQNPLALALELAPMGSLRGIIQQQQLNPLVSQIVASQVSHGLAYLHSLTIIYRDLKPANILVWSLDVNKGVLVKLSDYGVSKFAVGSGLRQLIGTEAYMSPEMWKSAGQATYSDKIDIFAFGLVLFELVTGVHAFWQFQNKWDVHSAVDSGFHPSLTMALAKQDSDINDEGKEFVVKDMVGHSTADSGFDPSLTTTLTKQDTEIKDENKESVTKDIDIKNEDSGVVTAKGLKKVKLAWTKDHDQQFSLSLKLPVDPDLVVPTDDLSYLIRIRTDKSGYSVSFAQPTVDESDYNAPLLDSLKSATVCCPYIQLLFNRCTSVVPGERPSAEEIARYLALYPTHYTKLNFESFSFAQCESLKSCSGDLSTGNNTVLLYGGRMCYAVTRSESDALTVAQIPLEGPLSAYCTAIAVMEDNIWVGWAISDSQHWVTVYDTMELQVIVTISVEDSALCFVCLPRQLTEEGVLIIIGLKNGVVVTVCLQQKNLYLKSKFCVGDPDQAVTCCCYQSSSDLVWIGCGTSLFLLNMAVEKVIQSWSVEQEPYGSQPDIEHLVNSSVGVWSQVCKGNTLKLWNESGSCCRVIALDAHNK
jgi:serine/threonine protein kinase/GTPase SAR1 family protein